MLTTTTVLALAQMPMQRPLMIAQKLLLLLLLMLTMKKVKVLIMKVLMTMVVVKMMIEAKEIVLMDQRLSMQREEKANQIAAQHCDL
jgi:hypothetical protein